MKKKRHTVEQIIRILREADSGLRNDEVCLRHNISQQDYENTVAAAKKRMAELKRLEAVASHPSTPPSLIQRTRIFPERQSL